MIVIAKNVALKRYLNLNNTILKNDSFYYAIKSTIWGRKGN